MVTRISASFVAVDDLRTDGQRTNRNRPSFLYPGRFGRGRASRGQHRNTDTGSRTEVHQHTAGTRGPQRHRGGDGLRLDGLHDASDVFLHQRSGVVGVSGGSDRRSGLHQHRHGRLEAQVIGVQLLDQLLLGATAQVRQCGDHGGAHDQVTGLGLLGFGADHRGRVLLSWTRADSLALFDGAVAVQLLLHALDLAGQGVNAFADFFDFGEQQLFLIVVVDFGDLGGQVLEALALRIEVFLLRAKLSGDGQDLVGNVHDLRISSAALARSMRSRALSIRE